MKTINIEKKYYSQFGEDKILAEIFNEKLNGLCIEVGANDGVNDSTTMYFEKIGWDCILIEPNPDLCKSIRIARKSTLIEVAASDKSGEITLFVAEGAERAHGVSTLDSSEVSLNKIKSYGFTYREVQVQTKTLDTILGDLNTNSEIDFISVDVEGHELEALRGFSIQRWMPTIILIEDNSNHENDAVSNYLSKFGYYKFKRTGVNDWYAHKKNNELINFISIANHKLIEAKIKLKNKMKKVFWIVKIRNYLLKK